MKILLGNMLQAPSWKCSSPCHVASDGYTAPISNLSHRLRPCHMCFLTGPQSFLQPAGLHTHSWIRDKGCAMFWGLEKAKTRTPPPLPPLALVHPLPLINNTLI